MKKIVLALALMMATLTVAADNILYFTYNQAARTVACLNRQDELMIYCGYEYELPTYVLINEVWAEQISSSFYEIWLYGYDAYTGEEIYMPIDLECIYLMQNRNIYSAAQYLRFKYTHSRPTFAWAMPPYNPFVRAPRPVVYYYTYHYDIHRPGWHYSHYKHIHYHPYYHRLPHHPAPLPPKPYTPGHDRPGYHEDPNGGFHYTGEPLVGHITASRSQVPVQNDPTRRSGNRITSNRGDNTITTTDRVSGSRNTTPAPGRTGEVSRGDNGSNSRSGVSNDNNSSRGTNTNNRSGVSTNDNGNSRSNSNNSRSNVDSGNSRGNNSNNRSGVSTSDNNSRGNNSNNRSGVSTNDNNSSRNTSTKESDNSRSKNTSTSTSRTSSSNKESDSRSSSTSTSRGNNNSRGSATTSSSSNSRSEGTSSRGTSTSSSSNSRSGSATNSRGSNNRTRN